MHSVTFPEYDQEKFRIKAAEVKKANTLKNKVSNNNKTYMLQIHQCALGQFYFSSV